MKQKTYTEAQINKIIQQLRNKEETEEQANTRSTQYLKKYPEGTARQTAKHNQIRAESESYAYWEAQQIIKKMIGGE